MIGYSTHDKMCKTRKEANGIIIKQKEQINKKKRGTRMCTPVLAWLHKNRMGEYYIVEDNRRTSSGIIGMIGGDDFIPAAECQIAILDSPFACPGPESSSLPILWRFP